MIIEKLQQPTTKGISFAKNSTSTPTIHPFNPNGTLAPVIKDRDNNQCPSCLRPLDDKLLVLIPTVNQAHNSPFLSTPN
ncbi:hypothetical protein PGT21_031139 [Puccinia graminis f. sp. tritici]|uniref:Uncharacterized protein n=1 Tax=Puccinia graminis f. sp. tritici TaxID=56615 RepID=A0A5B0QYA2_PUCGR|nr:hypothetical protein PGT21_031139 [Puccinia graminis f. sp. tritici]